MQIVLSYCSFEYFFVLDNSKKSTVLVPPLAEAKQETIETRLQDAQAASPAAASECEPIHFQPAIGTPDFSLNMPEEAEGNLYTASTIVQAKIGKDKQKSKHGIIISQNGVTRDSTQDVGDEEGRTSDSENLTGIDNAGDGSDFDCAVDYDDSDYRAYSSIDEKGDSNESHISRRHCAVTEKSRSNSIEDGGGSSYQGVSDDADSVGKQDNNGSAHQEVSKQAEETNEAEEHASLDCHERSRGEYETETREENGPPDMAKDKCNDEAHSAGNLLEADSFSKLSHIQKNSAPSNTFSASENTDNLAVVGEDHIAPGEDNIDGDKNEPVGDSVQAVCSKQALNSNIGQSSLKPSDVTCENSVDIEKNVWGYEISEKSLNQTDTTFSDTREHVDQLYHIFSSSKCQSSHNECPSLFPVENLSCPGAGTDSLNRTHDEIMQTDLDMLAFDDIFELHKTISLVGKFHHQICHVRDKHLSEIETAKSLQASGLEHNTSIAESQTEDTDWVRASDDQTETLEELQTKLSLRGQQLENTEKRLTEIKLNIHKLLGFIVPGTELGGANNIDQIIKDMIRVHEESLTQTQSSEAMEETSSQDDTSLS